jgi:hypothetical protein
MKATIAIVLGLILAASTAFSQESSDQTIHQRSYFCDAKTYGNANIPQAKKGFLWSTKSENNGVVEAALAHITHMRIMLPQEDMKNLESAVTRLVSEGQTPVIRYKAYLASRVFADPTMFREAATGNYGGCNEFFCAIATRLQQSLLSYSAH